MPKFKASAEEDTLYGASVKPPAGAEKPAAAPGAEQEAPPAPGDQETHTTDQEADAGQNTAVVPSKVLMPPGGQMPKAGDEIIVQVVKVYGDDEIEIRYGPKKPGSEEGPMSSDSEIESLDQKGMM